ncbi:MAG: carboxypeptidase regulatory-like domain-containing protein, partial [Acidobacteriaceae bacterium]|nr:carboxypeptidase regulatory-like domain-containing protein [Acidobacteriaceae bacterium]
PLNRVLVTINPAEHRETQFSCITASDGRFAFTTLPVGKYSLAAGKRSELLEGYNQDENYATAIAVGPGLDSQNIVFALDVPGSLSGTVLDEEGDPVPQAQVWLFRKRVFLGRAQFIMRQTQQTDSSGSFYIGHLAPGTYYAAVQGRPWYAQNSFQPQTEDQPPAELAGGPPVSELDVAYPVTYYGDSVDPASASPITISEGGSATVQITIHAVPALHVELAGADPQTHHGVGTQLSTLGPGGFPILVNGPMLTIGNRQILTGIAPGRYIVNVESFERGHPEVIGTKTIELTGDSNLDVRDLPKATLTGRVGFEANERPSGQVAIEFIPLARGFNRRDFNFSIASDGSLEATDSNIVPGRYQLQIVNAPGFFLKSINVKGAKNLGNEIDVPEGGSVQLSIIASKGLTRINGIAVKDENPIAGAMVLLVPQDLSRTDQFRRDQSDSDGTFSLFDVEPGRYTLVAIDHGHELEYENPEVINAYLSQGEPLEAPLRNRSAVKVNVQVRR